MVNRDSMTIRARLTFWYAGIMFASLLAMGALSYRHFVTIPAHRAMRGRESPDEVADMAMDFREVARIVLWSGAPALLLALGGGWWLTRKALAPVAALTQAAARINERSLREQLPRSGNGDELDRLTEVFNGMTARLDGSFQRVREFTLHASHELKTPLTVLRGELETALREEKSGAPPQPARLLSQIDEIDRLTKIVDGLTLLTKADAGQVALHREPLQLDELVRESFADANILAQPAGVRVSLSDCQETAIQGDRHRLRQLLLNLTDNAVKYNHPGGTVAISLKRAGARRRVAHRQHRRRPGRRIAAARLRAVLSRRRQPQPRGGRLRAGIEHRAMDCPRPRRRHPVRLPAGPTDHRDRPPPPGARRL